MRKVLYFFLALSLIACLVYAQKVTNKVSAAPQSASETAVEPAAPAPVEPAVEPLMQSEPAPVQPAVDQPAAEEVTLKGDIIDNMCADAQTPENLANFVATHTKECATAPGCVASGYSIYTPDGKLMKFDAESSVKVADYLKTADSKLKVDVTAKKTQDTLSLVSIKAQE